MLKKIFCAVMAFLVFAMPIKAFANDIRGFEAAKGAVLMEAASGRVLLEQDCHERLPNASTTKIMTAILTLEQPDIDEDFIVDANAINVEGSSMGLLEGDTATLRTLAWGMLLASGNDAANAAAVKIDGSISAFCDRMNAKAKELGMKDTLFSSPSGLEEGEHYTTAYDLALLARYALSNDDFATMAKAKSAKLYYGNPPYHRWLTNHNRLLWQSEDCIGIKTGFTKAAGRCLVSAAERNGLLLIAVTLGCPDDFNAHRDIYEQGFEKLRFISFEDMLGQLSVAVTGAQEQRVGVKALWQPGAYLLEGESPHVKISVELEPFVYAPIDEGSIVGSATLCLNDVSISAIPLVTAQDRPARFPETRSWLQRVKDFFKYPENYRFPLNEREDKIYGSNASSQLKEN